MQKLYSLRRPKTNVQIIQQNVLLKYKYLVAFRARTRRRFWWRSARATSRPCPGC